MSSRKQNPPIDPVVFVTLGVLFLAFAIILLTSQPRGLQGISIGSAAGSWSQIVVAFVTGLTTGGLSCLAVQGGLLASSMAHEVEQSVQNQPARGAVKRAGNQAAAKPPTSPAAKRMSKQQAAAAVQ